jgi:hypothetical protein
MLRFFQVLKAGKTQGENMDKKRVHNFFEEPKTTFQHFVQFLIFFFIILSVVLVYVERQMPGLYLQYRQWCSGLDIFILIFFTLEYCVRLFTAPLKMQWAKKPFNIIDFIAVFPGYLEYILPIFFELSTLRSLRIIRLLRMARVLRAFRLIRLSRMFRRLITYDGTILQAITPVITIFVSLKLIVWTLEDRGLWLQSTSLGQIFAIVGFALGIILSQKIGVSYDKFLQVDYAISRLYATMESLCMILDKMEPGSGSKACYQWMKSFLELMHSPIDTDHHQIYQANHILYEAIHKVEPTPSHLNMLHGQVSREAYFCLTRRTRPTPTPYDTLLQKSTLMYLALIAAFVPGLSGMISILVASYVLYGMYYLTQDIDTLYDGEFDLINLDLGEFKRTIEAYETSGLESGSLFEPVSHHFINS